jgi:hypothetical protein
MSARRQNTRRTARIFISYRRDETSGYAGRIQQAIKQRVVAKNVFIDLDTTAGERFPDVLRQQVQSASVVVAVLGPDWVEALHDRAKRPHEIDWVRFELETALKSDVRVVPVLVRGAKMPTADRLPPELRPLTDYQAHELADHRWEHDCELLAVALRKALGLRHDPAGMARRRRLVAALAVCAVLAGGGVAAAALIDAPPRRIDTTIESAKLEPIRRTIGEFMAEQHIKPDPSTQQDPDEEGLIFAIRVRLQGEVGQKVVLHWRLYDGNGHAVPGREYDSPLGAFTPANQDHALRASFWLPYPPRPGRYVAEFRLEDPTGKRLDVATTGFQVQEVPT